MIFTVLDIWSSSLSFYFAETSMVRYKFHAVSIAFACVVSRVAMGLCCHMTDILPLEGHYCNTQGDLDTVNAESLHLCQMNCLFHKECKAISYNVQYNTCTRHTVPCLSPHVQVNMVYHRLKTFSKGKFNLLLCVTD